ncbi:hypothetical protein BH23BAC3_BH23BAC3_26800 [soil metagenome]
MNQNRSDSPNKNPGAIKRRGLVGVCGKAYFTCAI